MFSSINALGKFTLYVLFIISFNLNAADPKLTIKPIQNGVYEHISYQHVGQWGNVAARGLVVVDDKEAYMIDTPWSNSDTEKLINWTNEQGFTLKAAVVTHFHQDASGGLSALNQRNIPTYAYKKTNQLLEKHKGLSQHILLKRISFHCSKIK
nr:MBL fold metallo-hydrolase [Pseudoalteromonas sp. T1lg24]